jgi:hypothetical protein
VNMGIFGEGIFLAWTAFFRYMNGEVSGAVAAW